MNVRGYTRWDYVQFPLHLLPYLLEDQKGTARSMIEYGIYHHAHTWSEFEGSHIEALRLSVKKLKLRFEVNVDEVSRKCYEIEHESQFNRFFPMVKTSHLVDLLREDKNLRFLMDFMAFVAIHSLIGKKKSGKVYKDTLVARMCGYVSKHDLPLELSETEKYVFHHHSSYDKMNRLFRRLNNKYLINKSEFTKRGINGYKVTKGLTKN